MTSLYLKRDAISPSYRPCVNEGVTRMWNVSSDEESRLIEKLRKIETLFAGTASCGKRVGTNSDAPRRTEKDRATCRVSLLASGRLVEAALYRPTPSL